MKIAYALGAARAMLLATTLGAALAACGGGGGGGDHPAPPAAATELTVSASGADATAGGAPVTLTAALNGAGTVGWTLAAGNPGTLSAATGASVTYTPPALGSLAAPATATITASAGALVKTVVLQLATGMPPAGLSLLAGNSASAFTLDGSGGAARFAAISGVQLDGAGNAYVLDGDTRPQLRRISAAGQVATLALPDDLNTAAGSLSVTADGSLYLMSATADASGNAAYPVRKRAAGGGWTTLFTLGKSGGDGARHIAVAGNGQIYIGYDSHIVKLAADGSPSILAGRPGTLGSADGPGADARFGFLQEMSIGADGKLLVLDQASAVRQVGADGTVSTLARISDSNNGDGPTATMRLHRPSSVTADAAGAVWLLDLGYDNNLNYVKIAGGAITTLFRKPALSNCRGQALGDRYLRIGADGAIVAASAATLSRLGADGARSVIAGMADDSGASVDGQGAAARYCAPFKLAADAAGNVYSLEGVAPSASDRGKPLLVRKTTPAGVVTTLADFKLLGVPTGILVDGRGRVLISVVQLDSDDQPKGGAIYQAGEVNTLTLIAGIINLSGTPHTPVDGTGAEAHFRNPVLQWVDGDGNLFVRDLGQQIGHTSTDVLRKVTPQAVVSTVALADPPPDIVYDAGNNYYSIAAPQSVVYRNGVIADVVAGVSLRNGTVLGALPGQLESPRSLVKTGPYSFALISGSALLRLTVPH